MLMDGHNVLAILSQVASENRVLTGVNVIK
jgi:hypothetical protein